MNSRFFSSRIDVLFLTGLRAESQIVHEEADQSANHGDVAEPLQRAFPKLDGPRNMRVLRQAAGQDLMHAGSSPSLTRSVQSVHLKTRLVVGFIFGMSNGHPVMQ